MLVLTRKAGEQTCLPDLGIRVTVLHISRRRVRLGVAAPAKIAVHRRETLDKARRGAVASPTDSGAAGKGSAAKGESARQIDFQSEKRPGVDRVTLKRRLAEQIARRAGRRAPALHIAVKDACVEVRGRVATYHARQLVQTAVCEVLREYPHEVAGLTWTPVLDIEVA